MDTKTLLAVDAYRRLERAERQVNEMRAALMNALRSGIDVKAYYRATEEL